MRLWNVVRHGDCPKPATGGDACLVVIIFESLGPNMEVGPASRLGDSYKVCMIEDLLAEA